MINIHDYIKIKDRYCIAIFGPWNELIQQLCMLRPIIETQFTGTVIYISCNDEHVHRLGDQQRIIPKSLLKKEDFSYINQICWGTKNPLLQLIEESDIKVPEELLDQIRRLEKTS